MEFPLPNIISNNYNNTKCYIIKVPNGRKFGEFLEKTIVCNLSGKNAINNYCKSRGFTVSSEFINEKNLYLYTKLPVIILVVLMLNIENENIIKHLSGAYPITMNSKECTCMNIIVDRKKNNDNSYSLNKFSLYYPNNDLMYNIYGKNWPIINGYSFRTAIFAETLDRHTLNKLRNNNLDNEFNKDKYGLIIDDKSEYEDCAYIMGISTETKELTIDRIEKLIINMIKVFGGKGIISLSYDPIEKKKNISALESEFKLFKKYA